MSFFYDSCLSVLYPPGVCGTFCTGHTFDCFLVEVHSACCEGGVNCADDHDVPLSCPVGCAIVFPRFMETCRDHIAEVEAQSVAEDFEAFEQECIELDGLALVQYAIDLQERGCQIDLGGAGRRQLQGYLGQWLSSAEPSCAWDQLNDLAAAVDSVCCESDNCAGGQGPRTCGAACAVSMHNMQSLCQSTLEQFLDAETFSGWHAAEQRCVDTVDSAFFLHAIETADCGNTVPVPVPPSPSPSPSPSPHEPDSPETTHGAESLPNTIVGYWPLDDDGVDASGHGLDGLPVNAEFVTGLWSAAFYFDGDDAVLVPDTGADSFLDVDTVLMLAWIMPAQLDVSGDRGIIMNKESVYEYGLEDNSGVLQGAFGPCWRWWGATPVPIEEWTHVGAGADGTHERHFVNGAFVEETDCVGELAHNDNPFKIGARGAGVDGHSSQFRGSVDEAMLFGSCLSEEDVQAVYEMTYKAPPPAANIDLSTLPAGLVGYWPLDGDAGDASGNMLVGEPLNAEWVEGNWGFAFFFDGDDALVIADNPLLDVDRVLMLGWINPSRVTTDAGVAIVMNKENVYEFGLQDNTASLQSAFSPCWRWFGTVRIPIEQWTHVGAGIDGEHERHYVNGAIAEETSCPGALTPNAEAFKIGARGGNGGHSAQFAGSIDEAMLFGSCCDDAAVAAVYEAFARSLTSPPAVGGGH